MTTITVNNRAFKPNPANSGRKSIRSLASRLLATLRIWRQRYIDRRYLRRNLLTMEDRLYKDIGLHPVDVKREAYKPFWQA